MSTQSGAKKSKKKPIGTVPLRQRVMGLVSALILLSLAASTLSVYRITEVNRLLDAINRVSVPLGRLFTQVQSDADILNRELERSLGNSHWKDPHWRPRPVPRWILDVLESEVTRAGELMQIDSEWASAESRLRWREWAKTLAQNLAQLRTEAGRLFSALDQGDQRTATDLYPRWQRSMEEWRQQIQWGTLEYDRSFRQTFSLAESRVAELRTGLEIILIVVIALSLMILWLGERALRPVGELTILAREITRRGLRKEDKSSLPEISLARTDEVSQLAREFHHMATALLEREKTVETQKNRLVEQNRLLREMGEFNENVLNSIASILIVTDLEGKIAQVNPVAAQWLERPADKLIGVPLQTLDKLSILKLPGFPEREAGEAKGNLPTQPLKIEPQQVAERVYGGQIYPLLHEDGSARGAILVLEDLTEELDLQERLRRAENLAAVGRMSAQVAHEVRNPLHSIGLEAEVAGELASRLGHPALKQSIQSILSSVDRLEKITENYLKLSKLSTGEKTAVDLSDVLDSVLATYSPVCEAQGVKVDWRREPRSRLVASGDRDLLEQVFGNLFRNALQALESVAYPKITWSMGNTETGAVWVSIQDNGPGIPSEVRSKLFTPFVTTRAQGTGLGLSFIKKVLEDHGGTIRCVERGEGQGACFELTLPAVTAAIATTMLSAGERIYERST
jgi:signal transduction histidine kinase